MPLYATSIPALMLKHYVTVVLHHQMFIKLLKTSQMIKSTSYPIN